MGKSKAFKTKAPSNCNRYDKLDDDDDKHASVRTKSGRKREKNRKVNAKSANDKKLRDSLECDGSKTIVAMAADGNCLFRSLSDQLFNDFGSKHHEVRSDVCDYLEEFEEEFCLFLILDEDDEDEDAADFETYVKNMRQIGEWGGNVELVAAARLYRYVFIPLCVYFCTAFIQLYGLVAGVKLQFFLHRWRRLQSKTKTRQGPTCCLATMTMITTTVYGFMQLGDLLPQ
jgi:OTU-like cysteine protease